MTFVTELLDGEYPIDNDELWASIKEYLKPCSYCLTKISVEKDVEFTCDYCRVIEDLSPGLTQEIIENDIPEVLKLALFTFSQPKSFSSEVLEAILSCICLLFLFLDDLERPKLSARFMHDISILPFDKLSRCTILSIMSVIEHSILSAPFYSTRTALRQAKKHAIDSQQPRLSRDSSTSSLLSVSEDGSHQASHSSQSFHISPIISAITQCSSICTSLHLFHRIIGACKSLAERGYSVSSLLERVAQHTELMQDRQAKEREEASSEEETEEESDSISIDDVLDDVDGVLTLSDHDHEESREESGMEGDKDHHQRPAKAKKSAIVVSLSSLHDLFIFLEGSKLSMPAVSSMLSLCTELFKQTERRPWKGLVVGTDYLLIVSGILKFISKRMTLISPHEEESSKILKYLVSISKQSSFLKLISISPKSLSPFPPFIIDDAKQQDSISSLEPQDEEDIHPFFAISKISIENAPVDACSDVFELFKEVASLQENFLSDGKKTLTEEFYSIYNNFIQFTEEFRSALDVEQKEECLDASLAALKVLSISCDSAVHNVFKIVLQLNVLDISSYSELFKIILIIEEEFSDVLWLKESFVTLLRGFCAICQDIDFTLLKANSPCSDIKDVKKDGKDSSSPQVMVNLEESKLISSTFSTLSSLSESFVKDTLKMSTGNVNIQMLSDVITIVDIFCPLFSDSPLVTFLNRIKFPYYLARCALTDEFKAICVSDAEMIRVIDMLSQNEDSLAQLRHGKASTFLYSLSLKHVALLSSSDLLVGTEEEEGDILPRQEIVLRRLGLLLRLVKTRSRMMYGNAGPCMMFSVIFLFIAIVGVVIALLCMSDFNISDLNLF
ncbi:hypothetical protein ADUPG1_000884 [Aduncisulcus paluster]|uniref:Uncharacterized protein n=1 Tax=Aduncisulcus paluster TaxID=2918883 RepID=A0ABQ5K8D2_9EUKA|nr:hypothetical protein ADUPG1_000884 [Aduncisulcus paluster]